ncbi:MAG: shikimate kinase [Candidatus Eisenbacteria bacterium]|uniref:Shikimate kinase n=1 Tax=Eiseniibacteriota bacterium TaxID=2212470 RepID=A0A948W7D0_UNCEI|nr:shikimate kinase [Candidatus Eisenbacteria bacterium]MBU1947350.1 shikimate kinase [Candidatus Eisenbacteria bacterium]MBU2692469.1 shikimate kinase [Candidatus Eisenbacteria bacterium]
MMGAGKSHVGRLLAHQIGAPYFDLDLMIEHRAGRTIKEIFRLQGEGGFRELEGEVFHEVSGARGSIISCGGGLILREGNRRILQERCFSVWLKVSEETLYQRLSDTGRPERPLLEAGNLRKMIHQLLAEREAHYSQADLTLTTDDQTPEEIVSDLRDLIVGWEGRK